MSAELMGERMANQEDITYHSERALRELHLGLPHLLFLLPGRISSSPPCTGGRCLSCEAKPQLSVPPPLYR